MKYGALCIIAAGVLFIISVFVQYGLLLNNLHGFCVPIGIPLILIIGGWIYHENYLVIEDTDEEDAADSVSEYE